MNCVFVAHFPVWNKAFKHSLHASNLSELWRWKQGSSSFRFSGWEYCGVRGSPMRKT